MLFLTTPRSRVGFNQGYFPVTGAPDCTLYVTLPNYSAFSAVTQNGVPITVSSTAVRGMTLPVFQGQIEQRLTMRPGPD